MGRRTNRFAAAALAGCLALFPIPHTLAGELAGFDGLISSGDLVLDFGGLDVDFVAGAIVKSITTDGLVTQQACNADLSTCNEETVQIDIPAQASGADGVVASGIYSDSTQVLTLTLSSDAAAATVDIDLSDLTTPAELQTAITSAISAIDTEDGVVTGGDFSGSTLTLTRSDGLSDVQITGIDTKDGVVASGTYSAATQLLTLTLSSDAAASTVDISLSGLTTAAEVQTAITAAISALDTEDGVVTGMDFSGTTLTLTRSDGLPPLTQAGIGGSGGMSMADGVVSGGSVSGTTLTLTRTETLSDVTITGLPELDLSDDTPQTVHTVGVAGTGDEASRDDHRHTGVGTLTCREGIQCNQTVGAVVAEARLSSAAPEDVGATESAGGTDVTISRSRHVHAGVTSITAGTGISLSPSDGQGTVTVTATGGGGGGGADDGVVDGADYSETTGDLTLTRTVGADLTENLDEIIRPDGSGDLPDPSTRQDRVAISGDNLLHAIDHGATDKIVGFKAYGPDRVVDTGEPALLQDEANFQGSFANPPSGTFSNDDFAWDRGSQVWIHRVNSVWITSGGPHGYAPGHLYATEEIAENHVTGTGYFHTGGVVIFGQGSAQRPYVITSFTAGTSESWQWDPIGGVAVGDGVATELDDSVAYAKGALAYTGTGVNTVVWVADQDISANSTTPTLAQPQNWLVVAGAGEIRGLISDINVNVMRIGDIFWLEQSGGPRRVFLVRTAGTHSAASTLIDPDNAIELTDHAHNIATDAHNDIRSSLSTVEDRLDALDPVEIEAYSSTATYERGSSNSIVTHANHVWVYVSSQRNTNHDPEQYPQYWFKLDTPIRVLNHDSATTTHWRSGDFFLTETGQLRIATATLSASPADIIADHTGADQEFLWLNEPGGGGGTTVTANPSGTDGADLTRIAIAGTNYNVAGRISWGFVIDTLLVPELNQDAISTARLVLEDSGLTHYLGFLGWTAADLDTIDHLPVGAHIGLRQGTTTRILEVEAEWDSTNNRYQVININDGVLLESASGAATELLLTAGTAGGGAGSNSVELWTGDVAVGTSNTWAAAGTDAVPSTARWILFNGGTLSDDVDDGAPADWRWINATDWRALTAAGSGDTVADGTAMQFAEWPSTDVASTNFTRRDVKIGRTSTNTVLITSMDAGEDFAGAAIRYVTGFAGGSGGGSDLAVQEEGTEVASAATVLNFTGTGATATASNGTVTIDISAASGITQTTGDARYLNEASNLSDLDSASTARTNLGLGDAAEEDVGLGSGNVPQLDSSGDLNVAVIPNTIARLISPTFTGNPASVTPPANDNDTSIATTAFVQSEARAVSDSDPENVGNAAAEGTGADASRHDHVHQLPINDTLEYASNQFGVNTQRVVQEVSEWVQHFASGDSHDTSGHSGKYHEYTSPNTVRRVGSVQYDFDPLNDSSGGGTGKTYQVFVLELSGRNVDAVLGSSAVYSGNSLQHRFQFTDGVLINPNTRIGVGLHRTDGGNNEGLSVRAGTESQNSPRESYDDASEDFNFVGRFNHDRPTPSLNDTVGGTAANQIYGNPEIFYQIIHTHESLVGDGTVGLSHLNSGNCADDLVLTTDGSGGVDCEASGLTESEVDARVTAGVLDFAETGNTDDVPVSKIPGGITHIESGATYNNNVISVTTAETVRGGDGILFAVPTPFGTSSTQTISLAINGQSNSTFPLHDRNGDALHEDDLTADSVYIAISDAASWDILILPDEVGSGGGGGASLSDATPDSLQPDQSGSAGTGTTASRHDHSHAIASSTPVGLGTSNQEGNFTSFARTNHVHRAFDSVLPSSHGIGQSGSPGTATIAARRDHVHAIPVGVPVTVGTANAEGTATTAARSDHVHEGDGAGGGSDLQVADEGTSLTTAATAINFAGAGVTATAAGTAVTVTIPGGGGSGAGNPNATRIVTGATYDAGAGGNETIEAPSWRSCDFLFPVFHDSSEAAAANANSNRPEHGVDMFFASALDTDGSLYVGVSQNEGVRILSAAANDFLTFQWVGTSPAPGSSDTLDIWCLDAGGSPGSETSDNTIASADTFDETTIAVPTGTWGFVNFGDIGEHYSGEWHRFLVADLTGQTATADGGSISDTNSLMFVANEEHYFFIGRTSGGNILVGSSASDITPGNVRMRTN